jgi:hypothetical protein
MRLILAAAFALACSSCSFAPAFAQDCTTYQTKIDQIEAEGGTVVGAASYDGSMTTEMLIVQTPDLIVLMGFDAKGCYYGMMAVEQAKKPDTGA